MQHHPYLRAYMAGVLLPTWFLLLGLAGFLTVRLAGTLPEGFDKAVVFPMAVVPNLWGVWNVLYLALRLRGRFSLGIFGALLPTLIGSGALVLSSAFHLHLLGLRDVLLFLPVAMAAYYLVWKFGVTFLNRTVGLP